MIPTKRQQDALRFIRGYQLAKGYGPSFTDVRDGLGLASKCPAAKLIYHLEERGHVRRLPNRARSIEVLTDIAVPRSPDGEPMFFVRVG